MHCLEYPLIRYIFVMDVTLTDTVSNLSLHIDHKGVSRFDMSRANLEISSVLHILKPVTCWLNLLMMLVSLKKEVIKVVQDESFCLC